MSAFLPKFVYSAFHAESAASGATSDAAPSQADPILLSAGEQQMLQSCSMTMSLKIWGGCGSTEICS